MWNSPPAPATLAATCLTSASEEYGPKFTAFAPPLITSAGQVELRSRGSHRGGDLLDLGVGGVRAEIHGLGAALDHQCVPGLPHGQDLCDVLDGGLGHGCWRGVGVGGQDLGDRLGLMC